MNGIARMWTVAEVELRQRVRGAAWYVLLGVFVLIVFAVTVFTTLATSNTDAPGAVLYSLVVYFVLLLGTLVAPALSGNAINGDRESGTLATTQVTLVATWQLVVGKFLAAWITALGFLVAALPFLLFALALGGASPDTALVSILVLALELGVVAAVGVGLSGLIRRPLFSVVVTYLVVAALSVGTVIAFGLGGAVAQREVTVTNETIDWAASGEVDPATGLPADPVCVQQSYSYSVPRFDAVWWLLAANPYVLLADAAPTHFDGSGNPDDLFGTIKLGVRMAQLPPEPSTGYSECDPAPPTWDQGRTPAEVMAETVPSWAVGLGLHVLLAIALLAAAVTRTRAPSRRLAAGSRIA